MKCVLVCEPNAEKFAALELQKRFSINSEQEKGFVTFECEPEQAVKVTYMSQTAKRILILLAKGKTGKNIETFKENLRKNIDKKILKETLLGKTFRIECERIGTHKYSSMDAEQQVGIIIEKTIPGTKVDLKKPELLLFLNITEDSFVLGADIAGRDLSKRQYRLFNHPNNIKGTNSFNALMYAGYDGTQKIADIFSLSGDIPIEAALYKSGRSPRYFDKKFAFHTFSQFTNINIDKILEEEDKKIKKSPAQLEIYSFDASYKNIIYQKKNAKIAGVEKFIRFSRADLNNIDLKFNTEKIDMIVGRIIEPSKHISENKAKNIYYDFFEKIGKILKKKGQILLVLRETKYIEKVANEKGFILTDKTTLKQGQLEITLIRLTMKGE